MKLRRRFPTMEANRFVDLCRPQSRLGASYASQGERPAPALELNSHRPGPNGEAVTAASKNTFEHPLVPKCGSVLGDMNPLIGQDALSGHEHLAGTIQLQRTLPCPRP